MCVSLLISLTVYATKKNIDEHAYDTNGKVWQIKGWIEYDFFPPKITHWDIWLWDPYKNDWFHFVGYPVGGSSGGDSEEGCDTDFGFLTTGYTTHISDSLGNTYELTNFDQDLFQIMKTAANSEVCP